MGNITVLRKGQVDLISDGNKGKDLCYVQYIYSYTRPIPPLQFYMLSIKNGRGGMGLAGQTNCVCGAGGTSLSERIDILSAGTLGPQRESRLFPQFHIILCLLIPTHCLQIPIIYIYIYKCV